MRAPVASIRGLAQIMEWNSDWWLTNTPGSSVGETQDSPTGKDDDTYSLSGTSPQSLNNGDVTKW